VEHADKEDPTGFGEDREGGTTPKRLREQSDFFAGQLTEYRRGEMLGQLYCSTEVAVSGGLLALYCEIRRLADLMPTAEDMRAHTAALERHGRLMGDHIQGMKRYGCGG